MAEGVAFSFLEKLAERMVDPIVRQFSYLLSYNSNIESLEQELKGLQAAGDGVKRQVVAAEHNLETIDPAMQLWLKVADEIERKASIVIDRRKSRVEKMCFNLGCPNVKQRYSLSRKATKLIARIGKHKSNGDKFAKSTHSASPPGIVTDNALLPELPTRISSSRSITSSEGFESRKSIVEEIMEALKDGEIRMIGICGIGGVGKTTMANEVCRRAKERGLFDEFAMTSVSQKQDLPKIQKELAGMLGLKLVDEVTMLLKAQRLRERLSNGRKILVILDDVWQELPLQEVGIPTGCMGCKVICTSRNKDVLSDMGTRCFDVGVLTDTESWDLFVANAGNSQDTTDQCATAKKIVKKCGGLPIAIVTLAKALKNKEKHVWDNVLRHLEVSTGEKIRGMAEHVYKCIELSYEFLRDSGGRTLLQICCLCPEDADILVKNLVKLKDLPALDEVTEDGVRTLVGDLISSNLLLAGAGKGSVKVHDVVREVCLSIEGLNKLGQKPQNREPSLGMANKSIIYRESGYYEEAGNQAFKQVMDALADDHICTIGILGTVGGVWEIILMDEVIDKVEEDNLFDDVVLTFVNGDLFEMQGDLARKLGLAYVEEVTSIAERAKQLRARLTDGRRTLIIIRDGLWEKVDLEYVGIPMGAEHNKGCKVAIVSGSDYVYLMMECEKMVRVEPLSEEEALVLFGKHARFHEELGSIAKQIVDKCKGRPSTIVRLGEALKNQNKNVWLDVLRQLEGRSSLATWAIKYSYNGLSSRQAQLLLLLICIMGITSIEILVVVWLKFFKIDKGDLEAARDKVLDLLQELHNRVLLRMNVHHNSISVISNVCVTILHL